MKARLLSYNNAPVWKIGNEIVTGIGADHIRFPELPDTLYSRPTLIWTVENQGAQRHRVEASYLAGKLAWNADYVLTVARDDKTSDVNGWVTLTNGSGTAFRNAKLQLVAGDLNRVRQVLGRMHDEMKAMAPAAAARAADGRGIVLRLSPLFAQPEDDHQQQPDQTGEHARRHGRADGEALRGRGAQLLLPQRAAPGLADQRQRPGATTSSRTSRRAASACRCPRASIRVYQEDSKGGVQFVGEDRINHTPKDETLNIKIGNAFDVVCERNQIDFQKIASNVYEFEYEITLRNHKATAIKVEVNEPIGGTWRMVRSSHESTKTAAWAAQFTVPVAADGTAVLKYRVRVTY